MTENEKKEVKEIILTEIEQTKDAIAGYEEMSKPVKPENSIGRISRMDAINNKSVVEAALRTSRVKLKNLQLALSKIDDQDFGICGRCKRPIPIKRVMLMPESRFCVHCAK